MERNINVAKILKSKSKGTKLYSSVFGQMTYNGIAYDTNGTEIWLLTENEVDTLYLSDGKYREGGEVTLYPSKKMRDWNKFAWKKGDILVSNDRDCHIIFEGFSKDDYTTFKGKHWVGVSIRRHISCLNAQDTRDYHIEDDKNATKIYINTIEKRLGGKLNLKTLEIEKQPEFKDGDILHSDETEYSDETIFIAKISGRVIGTYAYIDLFDKCVMIQNDTFKKSEINAIRLATDSEKQQLFDALAKEGKAWDAKKKEVVDLKPKIELKPFDKVLVRDGKDEIWEPAFFFRNRPELNIYKYQTVDGKLRVYCISFNEETAKLIGTSDDWKE